LVIGHQSTSPQQGRAATEKEADHVHVHDHAHVHVNDYGHVYGVEKNQIALYWPVKNARRLRMFSYQNLSEFYVVDLDTDVAVIVDVDVIVIGC
jgi:hypothetical protein